MSDINELELRARVDEMLNRRPAVGLAVGTVRNGRLEFFHRHGVADIASNTPVSEDTVFRIASITKTFTAIAVMQLSEQGLIDVDAPANNYLRAYRLIPAKASFRPATVRHLLTHTSGIPEVTHPSSLFRTLFGESVKVGRPIPSLAEYYQGRLRVQAEPGTRFTYTDHNFATLGQIVEDTGKPLDRYLREHVFEPLGMASTDLIRSERIRSRLATGYNLRSGGAKAVTDYEVVTAGAGAAYSTTRDMARYLAALVGGGANEHGRALQPATLAAMFEPHYQPLPGCRVWAWRSGAATPADIASSSTGESCPASTRRSSLRPTTDWASWPSPTGAGVRCCGCRVRPPGCSTACSASPDEAVRTDVPHHPEIWGDICGWYYLPGRLTDARARSMVGAGVEVYARGG